MTSCNESLEKINDIVGDDMFSTIIQHLDVLIKSKCVKRKRNKHQIPLNERCIAKKSGGEQCTRRKKHDSDFCGTHIKGTPHGIVSSTDVTDVKIKKKQIWAEEIKGICYYIDDTNNIYDHEDIIKNKENPKIIAKYKVDFEGKYSIPEYGI